MVTENAENGPQGRDRQYDRDNRIAVVAQWDRTYIIIRSVRLRMLSMKIGRLGLEKLKQCAIRQQRRGDNDGSWVGS